MDGGRSGRWADPLGDVVDRGRRPRGRGVPGRGRRIAPGHPFGQAGHLGPQVVDGRLQLHPIGPQAVGDDQRRPEHDQPQPGDAAGDHVRDLRLYAVVGGRPVPAQEDEEEQEPTPKAKAKSRQQKGKYKEERPRELSKEPDQESEGEDTQGLKDIELGLDSDDPSEEIREPPVKKSKPEGEKRKAGWKTQSQLKKENKRTAALCSCSTDLMLC